jgi:hypothetical protein
MSEALDGLSAAVDAVSPRRRASSRSRVQLVPLNIASSVQLRRTADNVANCLPEPPMVSAV